MPLHAITLIKKLGIVLLGLTVTVVIVALYLLNYKTGSIIKELVKRETNNAYEISFSDVDLAISSGDIRLTNAEIVCVQPAEDKSTYHIKVAALYFSMESWKHLFFAKELIIDSIYLLNPEISISQGVRKTGSTKGNNSLRHTYELLKQMSSQLGVKSLRIENASLALRQPGRTDNPFVVSNINLKVSNFSKDTISTGKLLLTDDIDLLISNQQWIFADKSTLHFSKAHFSGNEQYFEIDSCTYTPSPVENKGSVSVSSNIVRFTSHQLASMYEQEKLLLDSLYLQQPVLSIVTAEHHQKSDSAFDITAFTNRLFRDVNIHVIQVDDGQVNMQSGTRQAMSYKSNKTDIKIRDLDINADSFPHFSIGDIELNLENINFFTPDSLYLLSVDKFGFHGNNLICKNARFEPNKYSNRSNGLSFAMPSLVLQNISFTDLLEKKLVAGRAIISSPVVSINPVGSNKHTNRGAGEGMAGLYHSLNGMAKLINVKYLYIEQANAGLTSVKNSITTTAQAKNINATIRLNEFLQSESLFNIKTAIPSLTISEVMMVSPSLRANLSSLRLEGTKQQNHLAKANFHTASGTTVNATNVYWQQFDWDKLMNYSYLEIDSADIQRLELRVHRDEELKKSSSANHPFANIRQLNIRDGSFTLNNTNGDKGSFLFSNVVLSNFDAQYNAYNWEKISARLDEIGYSTKDMNLKAGSLNFTTNGITEIRDISLSGQKLPGEVNIREISFHSVITTPNLPEYNLDHLTIVEPKIAVHKLHPAKTTNGTGNHTMLHILKSVNIRNFSIVKGQIDYLQLFDSSAFTASVDLNADSLSVLNDTAKLMQFEGVQLKAENIRLNNKQVTMNVPYFMMQITDGYGEKSGDSGIRFNGGLTASWKDIALTKQSANGQVFAASKLSGNINMPALSLSAGSKPDWPGLISATSITNGKIHYANNSIIANLDSLQWEPREQYIGLSNISVLPTVDREMFFNTATWQKDYLKLRVNQLKINGIDLPGYLHQHRLYIREIIVKEPEVSTSRNKNLPVQHGFEKLMPTRLIAGIRNPFRIDSVHIRNATVQANEISSITQREGTIPLVKVDATIRNITNEFGEKDSLSISAKGILLNHYIRSLKYKESYSDSLSGFRMTLRMSPMDLTALSSITNPLAAVNITKGKSDTLWARIAGNKYAAFGVMNFYYRGLKIHILDKSDTAHRNFILSMENFVANKFVVKTNNKKKSRVFYVRDPEKFVFNYWIKSAFSGVITSAGVKSSKKYEKKYTKMKKEYSLPDVAD